MGLSLSVCGATTRLSRIVIFSSAAATGQDRTGEDVLFPQTPPDKQSICTSVQFTPLPPLRVFVVKSAH